MLPRSMGVICYTSQVFNEGHKKLLQGLVSHDSISSNINKVLLINPSANAFVFGDFNIHQKDWVTYSGRTDRPGDLL